jgi:hypothetical protein
MIIIMIMIIVLRYHATCFAIDFNQLLKILRAYSVWLSRWQQLLILKVAALFYRLFVSLP